MPYQAFMPSPPAPVYFNLGLRDAAETYQKNALENRKLKALTEQNALTQQSAQEKMKREQEKFEEEKRKSGLAESEKVREWQAGIIAQSPYDQVDTPDKLGMKVGGVDKIHPDISNLFNQNPQQAYQAIKTKYGTQPEPVKPISLDEQIAFTGREAEVKAKFAKPTGKTKAEIEEENKLKRLDKIQDNLETLQGRLVSVARGVGEYLPAPKKEARIQEITDQIKRAAKQYEDLGGSLADIGMEVTPEDAKVTNKAPETSHLAENLQLNEDDIKTYTDQGMKRDEVIKLYLKKIGK